MKTMWRRDGLGIEGAFLPNQTRWGDREGEKQRCGEELNRKVRHEKSKQMFQSEKKNRGVVQKDQQIDG